jgi:hypothetical protein
MMPPANPMEPNFASSHVPPPVPLGFWSSNEQQLEALDGRRRRIERVIELLLSEVQRRAAVVGPQRGLVGPTRLELGRLEVAHRLREDIEGELQACLDKSHAQA